MTGFWRSHIALRNLASVSKIAQTLSIRGPKMAVAVGRRNEEEADLRVRHLRY